MYRPSRVLGRPDENLSLGSGCCGFLAELEPWVLSLRPPGRLDTPWTFTSINRVRECGLAIVDGHEGPGLSNANAVTAGLQVEPPGNISAL